MTNSFNVPFNQIFDQADIMAIKALIAGNANETQQKRAISSIAMKLCRIGNISYCGESGRNTDFNEGVRYVGIQLNSAAMCNVEVLKKIKQQKPNPINN